MLEALPAESRAEILRLVPGLVHDPDRGYGPTARPVLRTGFLRRAARRPIAA
jgi:hypothetical protein